MNDEEMLEKLNQFTNAKMSAEDVFIFKVHLCDNDIDRDLEVFSDTALDTLQKLYIGKTGIFDHKHKATNQIARIFDTEIIVDNTKTTIDGRPYKYLRGYAYMVRTSSNEDLIKEIEGGIKKEVSVSCSAKKCTCSICGADRYSEYCEHSKGKEYNSKLCYFILDEIADAYEWSFVVVPAQVDAGVTKHFKNTETDKILNNNQMDLTNLKIAKIRTQVQNLRKKEF